VRFSHSALFLDVQIRMVDTSVSSRKVQAQMDCPHGMELRNADARLGVVRLEREAEGAFSGIQRSC